MSSTMPTYIFDNLGNNSALSEKVPRLYISAALPMCQCHTCGQVLASGPTKSALKQFKLEVHVKN